MCSDGLNSEVGDADIRAICLAEREPQAAADALEVYTDLIGEVVMEGAEVRLAGFGVFRRRHSAPRVLPNGKMSPPRNRMVFKAYSALNQAE